MFKHNEPILLTRQRHEAKRAGLHYDIRLVKGDKAYSWATKKEMPKLGETITIFEQPVHDAAYALSQKVVIPDGQYGAGVTTLDWVQKAIASNRENFKGKFVLNVPKTGERFLFRKVPGYGDTAWILKSLPPKEETIQDKSNLYLDKIASYREEDTSHVTSNGKIYYINDLLSATENSPIEQFKVQDLKWILKNSLNKDRVEKSNTSVPIIVSKENGHLIVLDGEHRLTKAVNNKLEFLPGKYINMPNKYIEKIASIHINPAHKGELHSDLGVPQNKKIPTSKLKSAEKTAGPAEKKRLVFAENARKWNK